MTKSLAKRNVSVRRNLKVANEQTTALEIAALAGVVSALLPSIPTIVKFWQDETLVSIFGYEMKYKDFLKYWVAASVVGLGALYIKFRGKVRGRR